MQLVIDLAERLGWNGVDNSKFLASFLEDYITEMRRKAAALDVLVKKLWIVTLMTSGPYAGRWVCGVPHRTWPACVSGVGDTPVEAIEAAMAKEKANE